MDAMILLDILLVAVTISHLVLCASIAIPVDSPLKKPLTKILVMCLFS